MNILQLILSSPNLAVFSVGGAELHIAHRTFDG